MSSANLPLLKASSGLADVAAGRVIPHEQAMAQARQIIAEARRKKYALSERDFEKLDFKLRENPEFEEVPLKRFRHKRAFRFYGTLCEITLVQEREGPFTLFWGDVPFCGILRCCMGLSGSWWGADLACICQQPQTIPRSP